MAGILGRVAERMRASGELPPLTESTQSSKTKEVAPFVENTSLSNPVYSIEETWAGSLRIVTGATQLRFKNHNQVLAPNYPTDWIMAVGDTPEDIKLFKRPSKVDETEASRRLWINGINITDNIIFTQLISQVNVASEIGPNSKIFNAKKLQEFANAKQNIETDLDVLLAKSVLNLDEIAQLKYRAQANTKK